MKKGFMFLYRGFPLKAFFILLSKVTLLVSLTENNPCIAKIPLLTLISSYKSFPAVFKMVLKLYRAWVLN